MAVDGIVKYEAGEDQESDRRNVFNDIGSPFLADGFSPDHALGSVVHAPSLNPGAEEAHEGQTDQDDTEYKRTPIYGTHVLLLKPAYELKSDVRACGTLNQS
jgi:hypothetical protein